MKIALNLRNLLFVAFTVVCLTSAMLATQAQVARIIPYTTVTRTSTVWRTSTFTYFTTMTTTITWSSASVYTTYYPTEIHEHSTWIYLITYRTVTTAVYRTYTTVYSWPVSTATITYSSLAIITQTIVLPAFPKYPFLAHEPATDKVYYIFDGKKHWIDSAESVNHHGFRWGSIEKSFQGLDGYEASYPISAYTPLPSPILPDGSLIGDMATGEIFYVYEGCRYWITDPSAFSWYGFHWTEVLWFDPAYINIYTPGPWVLDGSVPLPPGPGGPF